MANDIFGSLGGIGGLFGSIAKSVLPKDTPEGKLLSAQSEISDLQKQEDELLLQIGRRAYEANPASFAENDKLLLIRRNMADAQAVLDEAKHEKAAADEVKRAEEAAKSAQTAAFTCRSCGHVNPEGTKFCQECGSKLVTVTKAFCTSCGAELAPGTRFCGECGAAQE
jgi:RNA polymerase subunit RPABC4/transcription elongation factor Spt4